MHSSIFVVLNRAIPGAPAARDGRSLALWASVNLFTKGAGMASTAPTTSILPEHVGNCTVLGNTRKQAAAGAPQSCWSSAALNPRRATPRSDCSSPAAEIELELAEGARDAAASGAMPSVPNEGRTGRACVPSW